MKYKILVFGGFKLYFDQVSSIFKEKYNSDGKPDYEKLVESTGLNRGKIARLLAYLCEIGFSKKINLENTRIGELIFKYDPYLETLGTLYIMHYLSASNPTLVVWNRIFNNAYSKEEVTKEEAIALFEDLRDEVSSYTFNKSIGKEITILLDAYTNQRYSKLGLLEFENAKYHIVRNSDIIDFILLASIIKFRDYCLTGASAVSIDEICKAENSPGRLFFLDESCLRSKLEVLKSKGLIGIESRADLDQVRLSSDMTFEGVLEQYYKSL